MIAKLANYNPAPLSEQQSTNSLCLRFPSRWTVYAVPSSTLRSRSCRRRCYTGSMGSSLRCQGEKVRDAIIRWHVRVTLWRRCTCASRCCRCHSANTLSASTSASLLARFLHLYFIKQFFSQFDWVMANIKKQWPCRVLKLLNFDKLVSTLSIIIAHLNTWLYRKKPPIKTLQIGNFQKSKQVFKKTLI